MNKPAAIIEHLNSIAGEHFAAKITRDDYGRRTLRVMYRAGSVEAGQPGCVSASMTLNGDLRRRPSAPELEEIREIITGQLTAPVVYLGNQEDRAAAAAAWLEALRAARIPEPPAAELEAFAMDHFAMVLTDSRQGMSRERAEHWAAAEEEEAADRLAQGFPFSAARRRGYARGFRELAARAAA